MKTLEDLHLLVRLLKDFELPISPILEFAIKEKEEELASNIPFSSIQQETKDILLPTRKEHTSTIHFSCDKIHQRNKNAKLRVYRNDGSIIQDSRVAYTFAQTIKEIGPKRVMDLDISSDGMNLVTIGGNPLYPSAQKEVGEGYCVNTHSGTAWKKQILERIFESLHLSWKVEIVYE